MNMNSVKKAAEYLMYKGPTLNELILEAGGKNFAYTVKNIENDVVLEVKSNTSYDLEIIDRYWYNSDNELYKQTLTMRDKEKVIFDKYQEAKILLEAIKPNVSLIS